MTIFSLGLLKKKIVLPPQKKIIYFLLQKENSLNLDVFLLNFALRLQFSYYSQFVFEHVCFYRILWHDVIVARTYRR